MEQLRIFEFKIENESDYVAAYTFIHAMQIHSDESQNSLNEYDSDWDIVEIPMKDWADYRKKVEGGHILFTDCIKQANGKAEFLCSTAY